MSSLCLVCAWTWHTVLNMQKPAALKVRQSHRAAAVLPKMFIFKLKQPQKIMQNINLHIYFSVYWNWIIELWKLSHVSFEKRHQVTKTLTKRNTISTRLCSHFFKDDLSGKLFISENLNNWAGLVTINKDPDGDRKGLIYRRNISLSLRPVSSLEVSASVCLFECKWFPVYMVRLLGHIAVSLTVHSNTGLDTIMTML